MRRFINSFLVIASIFTLSCSEDFEATEYFLGKFSFYETEAVYAGEYMVVNGTLFGNNYISIPYVNNEDTDLELTISDAVLPEGLGLVENYVLPKKSSGNLDVIFTGEPTEVGNFNITFYLNSGANRWFIRVNNVEVMNNIDAVEIWDVSLKGPAFDDSNYKQNTYELTFTFANLESGFNIVLDTITGYLVPNAEVFAAFDREFSSLEPMGDIEQTVTIELPDNFLDYTVGVETFPTTADLEIKFTYNSTNVDENGYNYDTANYRGFVQKDMYVDNMLWGGYRYKTIELDNGQVWLDRNIGASAIGGNPVVMVDGLISDDWIPNYDTYGEYFCWKTLEGFPIYRDGANSLKTTSLSYATENDEGGYDYTDIYVYDKYGDAITDLTEIGNIPYLDGSVAYTSYGSSCGDATVYATYLNDTEDGGTSNPCPYGYRVPTYAEVEAMIEEVAEGADTSSANDFLLARLIQDMNFALTGSTYMYGPTNGTAINRGQYGAVGLTGIRTSSTPNFSVTPPSQGRIQIRTVTHSGESTDGLEHLVVTATGAVVKSSADANRANIYCAAAPTRCIKH